MPEGESWLAALVGWFCEVVCPATIVIRSSLLEVSFSAFPADCPVVSS